MPRDLIKRLPHQIRIQFRPEDCCKLVSRHAIANGQTLSICAKDFASLFASTIAARALSEISRRSSCAKAAKICSWKSEVFGPLLNQIQRQLAAWPPSSSRLHYVRIIVSPILATEHVDFARDLTHTRISSRRGLALSPTCPSAARWSPRKWDVADMAIKREAPALLTGGFFVG
jgi:hypothetical protein